MGCTDCGQPYFNIQTVCDCCRIVDGDTGIKKCRKCEKCNAFLCKNCWHNIPKRILAWGKSFFGIE